MGTLKDKRENLRKEIAALLEKISGNRVMSALSDNSPKDLDNLLTDLAILQQKIAGLQMLLALPDEKEPEPVVIVPTLQSEEPFVPVVSVTKEEIQPPPFEKPVEPVVEQKKPEPVIAPKPEPVAEPKEEKKMPEVAGKKFQDIRAFIGFNEKIMFLRQLFGNDSAVYDEALNHINSCISYEEAAAIIGIMQNKYSWNMSSEFVQTFTDTVKRRFA